MNAETISISAENVFLRRKMPLTFLKGGMLERKVNLAYLG